MHFVFRNRLLAKTFTDDHRGWGHLPRVRRAWLVLGVG